MMYNIGIHDHCDKDGDHEEFSIRTGTAAGLEPYAILHIGGSVDIFITPDRLQELQEAIRFYLLGLAAAEAEAEEQRENAAIEERDAMETGADRCPPRE